MKKNKKLIIGSLLLLAIILFSFLDLFITDIDYAATDLYNINSKPSNQHLLGTDLLGRDVFIRLVHGIKISLLIGVISTICQVVIGSFLGIVSGYFGGKINLLISTITDIFMCFPFLIVAIVIAAIFEPGIKNLILIIIFLQWMEVSRIVRAEVMILKEKEFIISSRLVGFSFKDIVFIHIIPNIIPSIIVATTVSMANAILIESSLSFLGLGVRPPMPSLGNILESAQNIRTLQSYWWTWLPAGIVIVIMIFSINLIGEGLKEYFKQR